MQLSPTKLKLLLKLIADNSCVKILLEIKKSDTYSAALSRKLGMPKSTVWNKLDKLQKVDIIEPYLITAEVGRRVKMYKFKDQIIDLKSISDILRCFEDKISTGS